MGSADFRLIRPVGVTADAAFSRASPKWVVDRTGTLVQVAADILAVTYDPSDLTKAPYALVEPSRTNYMTNSEASTGINSGDPISAGNSICGRPAFWVYNRATAYGDSPNKQAAIAGFAAGTWTASVYADLSLSSAPGSDLVFGVVGFPTTGVGYCAANVHFNPADLSVSAVNSNVGSAFGVSVVSAKAYGRPGGLVRLELVVQTAVAINSPRIDTFQGGDGNWMLLGLWQFEAGAGATSYVQTGSAPVARAADIIGSGAGLVYSNVAITEPTYNSGAAYVKNAQVYDPGSRLVYQSLIDANTGKALTDTTAWTPQLSTNRWLMFDKAVNSQTSTADLLVVAVKPGQLVNTLGVLNVSGSSITVTQTESYYSQTKSLVKHDVLSWYDWFYEEPIREGDVIFDGIPPYVNSTLVITVTNQGSAAGIGCCIFGKSRTIGQTAWDLTGGVLSYSTSTTDTFGNVTMVRRDNAKTLNFEVYIPTGFESEAYRLLREYTDVELMVVGAEDYSMTYSYGFLGQWSVPVTNSGKTAHIEFKGLV